MTNEDKQARLAVCLSCEHLRRGLTETCRLCGCAVRLKVRFVASKCPKGKWPVISVRPA